MRAPRPLPALLRFASAAALALAVGACGAISAPRQPDPIASLRDAGARSTDGEVVGRWLLGELLVPGGTPAGVKAARKRLDGLDAKSSLFASLGRAIDDEEHGRNPRAAMAYLDALTAARSSGHPDAPLVGWFAANRLLDLRSSVAGLWKKAREVVVRSIEHPGNLGWRARGELVEWWSIEGLPEEAAAAAARGGAQGGASGAQGAGAEPAVPLIDRAARRYGCIENARFAGPFGHLAESDHRVHYEAERAGPWPPVFPRDPRRADPPRVLAAERRGCQLTAVAPDGAPGGELRPGERGGVFYVETFVDLPAEREVLVAVQGAFALLVDDVEVLTRDTRQWGIWPRFGARLRLGPGRHRFLARVGGSETSIRLLAPDGTPLGVTTSADPTPPYSLLPPEVLPDPNPIEPFLTALGVPPQPAPKVAGALGLRGAPRGERDVNDPIARYLAAYVAHIEGQDDVSAVLLEPLVADPARATGPALAMQAVFLEKDPIFPASDGRDLVKDVRGRAAAKDPDLWYPRFWLALEEADKAGLPEVTRTVEALADRFREVPDILRTLAVMYSRLGWRVEHVRTVKEAAARFPDDLEVLGALLRILDADGRVAEADKLAAHIRELDPDAEIELERAIDRRDYAAAIKELRRLGSARRDRKDIALRIADLLTRAGKRAESLEQLERALAKAPDDADARLALADARFARGERDALQKALIEAIRTGADTSGLRDAIELLDGTTELSPYRQDSKKVIAEHEASGEVMPGTAARVLDYAAMWVHEDGSARMLQHEIIRIQSREAIQEHAEQQVPEGLVLKLRTVKRDGSIHEPEFIEDKPTVTMPHLEVGDYIEVENLLVLRGDGQGGLTFQGPRWFFREEKVPYWRSEFIVISPKSRPLDVETSGPVPAPEITESGALVTRRYRVDKSPALPEEPASAPMSEFLPNVRVGWGIRLESTLARMIDAAADETPRDPRLVRIARKIALTPDAAGAAPGGGDGAAPGGKGSARASGARVGQPAAGQGGAAPSKDEQARRIYRWVLANVEAGRENDGRRVVMGKSGNRTEAFLYLCRLLGIDAGHGVVSDRLTAPPRGPMSEAEMFNALAVRLDTGDKPGAGGVRWMFVRDKFAPYGYLPSSLRGQPAVVLRPGAPREVTPSSGAHDGVVTEGVAEVSESGAASLAIEQRYEGKLAIALRTALESLPDAQLKDAIESRLLPQMLPGARLQEIQVKELTEIDRPLTLKMKISVANFARAQGQELVLSPPFGVRVRTLASLPTRETPLYISEQIATRSEVRLRVQLPPGARVATKLAPVTAEDEGRSVRVNDRLDGDTLILERSLDLPAGRVQPDAYPHFQQFARAADGALDRDIVVRLGRGGR
ncbi:hypothetical protein SOCE26_085400 [Sorangium cellulosum]|uniref:DUF3857 domain-containing protein n=1 Tax=Sorangium cellulosum TaxID=56 RepID=A0A2L0F6G6_SORCE|nr:hypothetical protein [Sorangium cellulosum]AUX47029.1 hypothetical protein SOCE26_085400 [Sorangium cellulosum]